MGAISKERYHGISESDGTLTLPRCVDTILPDRCYCYGGEERPSRVGMDVVVL